MRPAAITLALALAFLTVAPVSSAHGDKRWPAASEHSFLVNCDATSHGKVAACRCELRWLERRYSVNQIARLLLDDAGKLRVVLLRAARTCLR
jgi:hypothetical protein